MFGAGAGHARTTETAAPFSRKRHTGAPRPWTYCDRGRSPGSRVDASIRPSRGVRLSGIDGRGSPSTVAGAAPELRDPMRPCAPHSLLAPGNAPAEPRSSNYGRRLTARQRESFPPREGEVRARCEWAGGDRDSPRPYGGKQGHAPRETAAEKKFLWRFPHVFRAVVILSRYPQARPLDIVPRTAPDVGVTVPLGRKTWWRRWEAGELHSDAIIPALPPQL